MRQIEATGKSGDLILVVGRILHKEDQDMADFVHIPHRVPRTAGDGDTTSIDKCTDYKTLPREELMIPFRFCGAAVTIVHIMHESLQSFFATSGRAGVWINSQADEWVMVFHMGLFTALDEVTEFIQR